MKSYLGNELNGEKGHFIHVFWEDRRAVCTLERFLREILKDLF